MSVTACSVAEQNCKVLETLEIGQKLCVTSEGALVVDEPWALQGVARFLTGNSRAVTHAALTSCVRDAPVAALTPMAINGVRMLASTYSQAGDSGMSEQLCKLASIMAQRARQDHDAFAGVVGTVDGANNDTHTAEFTEFKTAPVAEPEAEPVSAPESEPVSAPESEPVSAPESEPASDSTEFALKLEPQMSPMVAPEPIVMAPVYIIATLETEIQESVNDAEINEKTEDEVEDADEDVDEDADESADTDALLPSTPLEAPPSPPTRHKYPWRQYTSSEMPRTPLCLRMKR